MKERWFLKQPEQNTKTSITLQDLELLRAKTYSKFIPSTLKGETMFLCLFCDWDIFYDFNNLKMHMKENHLEKNSEMLNSPHDKHSMCVIPLSKPEKLAAKNSSTPRNLSTSNENRSSTPTHKDLRIESDPSWSPIKGTPSGDNQECLVGTDRKKCRIPNPLKRRLFEKSEPAKKESYVDLGQIIANPTTLKQFKKNDEIFSKLNENHEDDIFEESLLNHGVRLLNSDDSSSDSEVSVHSARSPIQNYMNDQERFQPVSLRNSSPVEDSPWSFGRKSDTEMFVRKRLLENRKSQQSKIKPKKRLSKVFNTPFLSEVKKQKKIDAGCKALNRLSNQIQVASGSREEEDQDSEQEDDYYTWSDEEEELSFKGSLFQ